MEKINVVRVKLEKEFQLQTFGRIKDPKDAVKIAADYLSEYSQEVFGICCLSSKGDLLNLAIIGQGTVNASLVDMRAVLQSVILSNATSIICIHNHPSGDCSPSDLDIEITEKLKTICKIMGYVFLDHIIVGGEQYYSFHEEKKLDRINELTFTDLLEKFEKKKSLESETYISLEL